MIITKRARTFLNVLRQGVKRNDLDYYSKVIRDGKKNDFPQYLTEIVYKSPTTTTALSRRLAFIQGKGFQGEIGEFKVNADDTLADFHEKISTDFNLFGRFAIRIEPSRGGGIAAIHHVPAEWVRWGQPDEMGEVSSVYFNPYILTSEELRNKKDWYYPVFSNVDKLKREVRGIDGGYNGHILFFNLTSPRNRNYSRPSYFSAEDYIRVDSKIGQFHDRNTDNNFFLGGILSVVGDPNEGIRNADGDVYKTLGELFEQRLAEAFSGTGNAGTIMVDWVTDQDHAATMTPWAGDNNHEKFALVYNQAREVISVATGIPMVLLGISTPGKLGDTQEIRNAIRFVNEQTASLRHKLEKTYMKLLPFMQGFPSEEIVIKSIQDNTDLPDNIFASLTQEQKEKYLEDFYNIEPSEDIQQEIIEENGSDDTID